MLHFFSFCCLIGRIQEEHLLLGLNRLLKSLDYHVKEYKFILYTNFNININNKNVIIRDYYDNTQHKLYHDSDHHGRWLNLSFNKINIYKDLYDEFKEDYIWTDLDLLITHDISYLENIDNFFIEHGGNCNSIQHPIIYDCFYVPENKYIQGAFWKININLYNKLMDELNILNSKNLTLVYDTQSLFAYYLYHTLNGNFEINNINVSGNNYKPETINGLGIWSDDINKSKHTNIEGLNSLYKENNIIRTKYYPDKEIHIIMFTFYTYFNDGNDNILKELFDFLN